MTGDKMASGEGKTRGLGRKMRWAAVLGAILALGALYFVKAARPGGGGQGSGAGKIFTLADAGGKTFRLESLRGSFVLLHFWAAWCDPCVEEVPHLIEFARAFPGLKIVAVSLDPTWEKAHTVWPPSGVPANVVSVLDAKMEVAQAYGSFEYPETYLLRPDLTVQTKWIGPQDWGGQDVRKYFETLLAIQRSAPDSAGKR